MPADRSDDRSTGRRSSTSTGPARYEIRIRGRLEPRWTAWFDGLESTVAADGTSVLRGPLVDQAALHGVLQRLRDLGIQLVSLSQVDPDLGGPPTGSRPGPATEGN